MYCPIETTRDGEFTYEINQNVSRRAWELTHECLRSRLSCKVGNAVGATFIDATFMSDRAVRDIKRIVLEETQGRAILDFTKFAEEAPAFRRGDESARQT